MDFRTEVLTWMDDRRGGVTTNELNYKFPGIPIRAMENDKLIINHNGLWYTQQGLAKINLKGGK